MISPKEYAKETGLSYAMVQQLAKEGKIKCEFTPRGQIQIYDSEIEAVKRPKGYVKEEEYQKVLEERDRYKGFYESIKKHLKEEGL